MKDTNTIKVEVTICTVGVMVVATVNNVKLREDDLTDGRWPIATRNALYKALRKLYPGVSKVKIPPGDNSKAWDAVVREYDRQVFEIQKQEARIREG
ncbi:MAG: hypothetical protein Q7K35_05540 [bacterium]|nr:hypothetical protein [bacterium]